MARIVLITAVSARPGLTEPGDVLGVHPDGTVLDGPGYELLKIVDVPGLDPQAAIDRLAAVEPQLQMTWLDQTDGKWKPVAKMPHCHARCVLTSQDEIDLLDPKKDRAAILARTIAHNFARDPANTTIVNTTATP